MNFDHSIFDEQSKEEARKRSAKRWTEQERGRHLAALVAALAHAREAALKFTMAYCAAEIAGDKLDGKDKMVHNCGHGISDDAIKSWAAAEAMQRLLDDPDTVIPEDADGVAMMIETGTGEDGEITFTMETTVMGGTPVEGPGWTMTETLSEEEQERLSKLAEKVMRRTNFDNLEVQ